MSIITRQQGDVMLKFRACNSGKAKVVFSVFNKKTGRAAEQPESQIFIDKGKTSIPASLANIHTIHTAPHQVSVEFHIHAFLFGRGYDTGSGFNDPVSWFVQIGMETER